MTAFGLATGLATLVWWSAAAHARRVNFTGDNLVAAVTRRALDGKAPALDAIRGEVYKHKDLVEAHAQEEIMHHAHFRELRGFWIDYQSLRCVSAPRFNDPDQPFGSCVAEAHAFQLSAEVAVNVSAGGISVRALRTVVD